MKGHPFKHLHTINKHRRGVLRNSIHMGIFFHALKHDLTKYSFKEFHKSSLCFDGHVSPVNVERKETGGYSSICQHHTKRNAHHWEYWTDFYMGNIVVKTMPYKFACEYVCDMISASKVYNGKSFQNDVPVNYFKNRVSHYYMTQASIEFISWCLEQFKESGWKDLKKANTKKKYIEITSKLPDVEIIQEIRHDKKGE